MNEPNLTPFMNSQQASSAPSEPVVQTNIPSPNSKIPVRSNNNLAVKLGLIALYLLVFLLGIFLTYTSQHSQLTTAQRNLTNTQNQLNAISPSQQQSVNQNEYQAVFLTSGQVYFGKLTFINKDYMKLTNIYYIQNGQTGIQSAEAVSSSSANVSLVKLGCEIHAPEDLMVINNNQVSFWENIRSNGEVAGAIKNFLTANPNGQTCPK